MKLFHAYVSRKEEQLRNFCFGHPISCCIGCDIYNLRLLLMEKNHKKKSW